MIALRPPINRLNACCCFIPPAFVDGRPETGRRCSPRTHGLSKHAKAGPRTRWSGACRATCGGRYTSPKPEFRTSSGSTMCKRLNTTRGCFSASCVLRMRRSFSPLRFHSLSKTYCIPKLLLFVFCVIWNERNLLAVLQVMA